MPQSSPPGTAREGARPTRRRLLRDRAEQRAELDRRVRQVAAMMRSLRTR